MTDRPIIFSAPMIRALLDGRKTMTRRLAWRYKVDVESGDLRWPSPWQRVKPGDRLWVRETCSQAFKPTKKNSGYVYLADHGYRRDLIDYESAREHWKDDWKSPRHAPRASSRLTLIVTATKIERLQDISYVDAHREGVEDMNALGTGAPRWRDYEGTGASAWFFDSRQSFASLWRSLHGSESWAANPEVVALTFRVVRANIDSAEARTP